MTILIILPLQLIVLVALIVSQSKTRKSLRELEKQLHELNEFTRISHKLSRNYEVHYWNISMCAGTDYASGMGSQQDSF
jgi:hypothetical protein